MILENFADYQDTIAVVEDLKDVFAVFEGSVMLENSNKVIIGLGAQGLKI